VLTAERLKEVLSYDPLGGAFTWLVRPNNKVKVGAIAGRPHMHGYVTIGVDGGEYLAHRLAWLWMCGEWPEAEVDHANCVRNDNRWTNLRPATRKQNRTNSRVMPSTVSGIKGVYRQTKGKPWRAQIMVAGKSVHLGSFDDQSAAHAAYVRAASDLHGEYARG
jgi:hypothetical protein